MRIRSDPRLSQSRPRARNTGCTVSGRIECDANVAFEVGSRQATAATPLVSVRAEEVRMKRTTIFCAAGTACVLASFSLWATVSAQSSFPDPNTCAPAECGRVSPLVPMQSTEAVHMGLEW